MKRKFDPETCTGTYNTTSKMPELTGYEHNLIPRGMSSNTRYESVPECPNPELEAIEYVEKKYSRTIRGLDKLTAEVLKDDILYGKSTITSNKMLKPYIKAKITKGDITLGEANEDPDNFIYWKSCYKGLQWARLQYVCKLWGVELIEAPAYEK
jgi:hypothetical protein